MTKKKKRRKSGPGSSFEDIKKSVAALMGKTQEPLSVKQATKRLGIKDRKTKQTVQKILKDFNKKQEEKNWIKRGKGDYYIGKVDFVNPRFAYIIVEGLEEDIYVKAENLLYAFDDDTVKVVLLPSRRGRKPEGKVVEIIERFRDEFVGLMDISGKHGFVIPDFRKMHQDIYIPSHHRNNAQNDDKVLVKITQWPSGDKKPEGKVLEVLGKSGDNEAEIHSIIAEFGLPYKFPEHLERAAKKISDGFTKEEIRTRKDFRDVTTFTIDPEDAKDFDDALSLKKLPNGHWEVGVHIADVTFYVKETTSLNEEAEDRATSVYLVDRTIPMLPERLSNELCSLRPNEDKFTFSTVFELDGNAHVQKEWFGRTIIHSNRRFTYEEAQERIETMEGDYAKEITLLNELALKLKVERFQKGAINFETQEFKFRLDDKGKPLEVIPKVRKDAHKLIEEFMLLANKRVAEFIHNKKGQTRGKTFVYRTHDLPDPEKLNAFSLFAKKFGYQVKMEGAAVSNSINSLIDDIEGKPEQNVLQSLAIRSMAKAKYTTDAEGHFGLAFPHYTHFTSPIRRYPDMMVHRLLQRYLDGGRSVNKEKYEELCKHSSEMEKRAADAERASVKYKQVEFMSTMLGEDFDGLVSGVTEWGIYVELIETKCEGMVRITDLTDDYYDFDPDNYRLLGRDTGNQFMLGDKLRVKVIKTDINRRTIDLELVEQYDKED
ncbi:MAG TPA: ribonuclease R [Cytophagales bacterium]|jgi:ribonuclease R|nr:ribonuclease R [Cytophagales bacterium]